MTKSMMMIMTIMLTISSLHMTIPTTSTLALSLILFIMMTTMMISMKLKLTILSFITFLSMISGLMILFMYFMSTMSYNEPPSTKMYFHLYTITTTILIITSLNTNSLTTMNNIELFNWQFKMFTNILIILLTMVLVSTIKLYWALNKLFGRKLKI